jgi:hypothetical protein
MNDQQQASDDAYAGDDRAARKRRFTSEELEALPMEERLALLPNAQGVVNEFMVKLFEQYLGETRNDNDRDV